MKKWILILIISLLSFVLMNKSLASQTWDCGDQGNNVVCTLDDDGTFTVSGSGKMQNYDTYEYDSGLPSTTAPWGGGRSILSNIKNIIIEEGVTNVGSAAFAGTTQNESISIPKSVTDIESYAFYDNYALKSLYLPNVKNIGVSAFSFPFSLESIDMPNIEYIASTNFFLNTWDPSNLKYVGLPDGVTLAGNVFGGTAVASCGRDGGSCLDCADGESYKADTGCVADCGDGFVVRNRFCISSEKGCGTGYYNKNGTCTLNPKGCETYADDKCSACSQGYLSKGDGCVDSAVGCGDGYKAVDKTCKRKYLIYTIEEANAVAGKTNTVSIRYR